MKRKWFHSLLRRRIIIALLLVIQVAFLVVAVVFGSKYTSIISSVLGLISLFVCLYILSVKSKDAFKITWIFLILLFPLFGGLFYLFFSMQTAMKKFEKRQKEVSKETDPLYFLPSSSYEDACNAAPEHVTQMRYLEKFAGFPVYSGTKVRYLTPGEKKHECLLEELKKAKKYIFLEYFIIEEGIMWNSVLEILKEKVREGVDVRVMYDDMGCFLILPKNYRKTLESYGIKCQVFNPFRPFLSTIQNNRDHRKIVSIDGEVAFTGGINLADEYINAYEKHGHWKDASVVVYGRAAWSLTLMFLEMWCTTSNTNEDYASYYPWKDKPEPDYRDGYVQPYCDSPMDKENVGEHVYLQMIGKAQKYIYINTPYLIVDENMISALSLAAKSGVDVKIVTPHHPDKKLVHATTRSYYYDLINAGVHIYEYSKGFMHSKTFVCDDCMATVGTTNLDFRSLYLHFECGIWMYGNKAVAEIKKDYLETLEICEEMTLEQCKGNIFTRLKRSILRLAAPLM